MKSFHIRVNQNKYEDYPVYSFYDINAPDWQDAQMQARRTFCSQFGFKLQDTDAYTFNKYN